jgi:hypothetical protein
VQLQVIWNPVLQPDSEGPALISHAAWLSRSLLNCDLSSLRGARRVARGSFTPRPSQNRTGVSRRIRLFVSSPRPRLPTEFLPITRLTQRRDFTDLEVRSFLEFLPLTQLTPRRNGIREPLRSMPITALRRYYEFIRPWVALRYFRPWGATPCAFSLGIATPGSQVTDSSPPRTHAPLMPDAALAVSGSPQHSSRSNDYSPVLTSSLRFRHFVRGSLAFVFPRPT